MQGQESHHLKINPEVNQAKEEKIVKESLREEWGQLDEAEHSHIVGFLTDAGVSELKKQIEKFPSSCDLKGDWDRHIGCC